VLGLLVLLVTDASSVLQGDALNGDATSEEALAMFFLSLILIMCESFSETDAFARVWIGRKKFKNQTQVFQNTNAPAWNETFEFHPVLMNSADYRWLLVEVFDTSSGKARDMGYFKVLLEVCACVCLFCFWQNFKSLLPRSTCGHCN
jgi:hypothetical protein